MHILAALVLLHVGDLEAHGVFSEKYGDTVRVVDMGEGFSVEFCGGTHLPNTAMAGAFRIKSESGAAGRRPPRARWR